MDRNNLRSTLYQIVGLGRTKQAGHWSDRLNFGAIQVAFESLQTLSNGIMYQGTATTAEMGVAALHHAGTILTSALRSGRLSEDELRQMFEQTLAQTLESS